MNKKVNSNPLDPFKGINQILLLGMRIFTILLCIGLTTMHASSTKAQTRMDVSLKNGTLKELFNEIEAKSEYIIFYKDDVLKSPENISIDVKQGTVTEILDRAFGQTNLIYKLLDRQIVVKRKGSIPVKLGAVNPVLEQQLQVSGTISDTNGAPLPGANIVEKNTPNGVTADFDGNFSISVADENAILVVSYIGFGTIEAPINGRTNINIVLEESSAGLDEVVVVGYGTAKKTDLTGAIASVNIEDTRLQPNANASQILRGTTAGVQIRDNGRPGQTGDIRIRGTNSISASNNPLLVLDGIIYNGGSLSDINPGDIESISILKDASSTAVYGSLAANGVIEVTTKKGKTDKPKITFNTYTGFSDFAHIPDYLNAEQYLAIRLDGEAADGGTLPFTTIEEDNIAAGISIDPFEVIKQSAPLSNYEINVSGRTENVNYFFSGSYLDVKSPVKGDNFSRISSRLNLSVKTTDWLKLGVNAGYTSNDDSGVRVDLSGATYLSPYASLYLEDGISPRQLPIGIGLVRSPIIDYELNDRLSVYNTLFTNVYLEANVLPGLSYKLNTGYTKSENKLFTYVPTYEPLNRLGSGYKRHSETQNLTLENILNYKKTFNDVHNLGVTLLYGIYEFENQISELSSNNIFNDALRYNSLELGENYTANTGARENKQTSSMARLSYNYSGKYFIDLSVRRDGYSAFGQGNKYGNFPAAGVSWNVSDEEFLKNANFMDFLKFRTSWGRNGNRGVSEYSSLSNTNTTNYVFGDGSAPYVGVFTTSFANPNLGWETTESLNFGIDLQLFDNRVTSNINYYVSNTKDLLLNQRIPNTNGFDSFLTNVGETENRGLEIDLKTVNIKTENFSWTSSIAFSLNRNKIVKLVGRDLDEDGVEDDDIASGWFIGEPLGSIYDYVFDGIYQDGDNFDLNPNGEPGDIRFKDISGPDGIPDGIIGPDDRRVIDSNQPDFQMGLTNIFRYKSFSLSSTFFTSQGGKSPNITLNPGTNFYDQANFVNVPYWTPDNPINTGARINYRNPLGYQFAQDRSFVRLQDISLSYDLPSEVLSKIGITGLQIYASGKNLITWTDWKGWDPEFGAGLRDPGNNGPLLKTYTFGINFSL